tara:strand:- start:1800 stop:2054 length:255 start_codon:yes stop_codon:yes gene_type:complete
MKQDISVLNLQPWLLKKNLAEPKKNNSRYRLLLTIIVFFFLLVLNSSVKYSQRVDVAMHDKGFDTAVFFYLHSSSGYAKKDLHG